MFKTFMENDVVSTRTLLHESIPITGSIVSGTYFDANADAADNETNIKNYTHGLFQSVYDYPYLSSSANHIFDLTMGYSAKCSLSGTDGTRIQQADKINMYNQMAQILSGHDTTGNIREFDIDGDLTGGNKMNSLFFVNFSRLLVKDEIKKGSFKIQLMTGSADSDPAKYRKNYGSAGSATAVDCIDTTGYTNSNADASFTISIPTSAGGLGGTAVTILLDADQNGGHTTNGANTISIGTFDGSETDALAASYIIDAINGVPTATNARIVYASSGNGQSTHDLGVTAAEGTSNTQITLTMDTAGTSGNIASAIATASGHNMIDVTDFTGGATGALSLQDHNGTNAYLTNSPAGEYGLLFSSSADAADDNKNALGHIYYQAGIAAITSSIFRRDDLFHAPWDESGDTVAAGDGAIGPTTTDAACGTVYAGAAPFGWLPGHVHGTDYLPTGSVEAMFVSASISGSCSGFRNALYNVEFNNTTELNSTIYFCRAGHNEFNYTSNPTYVNASKIIVKNNTLDQPVSYITTIGLYSAKNELLAVAKLSEPIKKTPDTELTFRVRLDY